MNEANITTTIMKTSKTTSIKLLFTFKNDCLTPVRGQNKVLDKMFRTLDVQLVNINGYNKYTKEFINNINKGTIYVSDSYSYDPTAYAFNFSELREATPEELDTVPAASSKFSELQSYDFMKKANGLKNTNIVDYINKKVQCPSVEESGFYVNELNWKFLVRNIMKQKNTILVGPTGTGKTELVMNIAKKLGLECNVYDMGAMQDPLTDLLGTHRIENGSSVFDYAKFVDDVQKPGIILLDELSRAPQMAMNILFPCLDSRRELRIDIAGSNGVRKVNVHPECVFIATANIGAEYSGTTDIDTALLNRFLPMKLDYMPQEIEMNVLQVRTGVPENIAHMITNYAKQIRQAYKSETISKSLSTRETLAIAELVEDGFSIKDAVDYIVLQKFQDEDEVLTIKSILIAV